MCIPASGFQVSMLTKMGIPLLVKNNIYVELYCAQ